ncbi:hypothetical protein C7S10_19125 [Nocardioides currus]|uniref:HTH cro/C1-type domain-containing protein n=1 Tax=Nocardioides currus TaxID=2133958 RepID=A0A2R7YSW2_9ACTN|nr:hypothetical protein C7S10_19125 [Nocardioides currus]
MIRYHGSVRGTRTSAGELVRARRERLGLSQRAAARTCGVPQSMLSRIENGETQPSIDTLRRVLLGLGADLHLETLPPGEAGEGRREKQRSVWLNRAVVGELIRDPDRVVAIARDNIARWRGVHAHRPGILAALDHWEEILDAGVEEIVSTLTGPGEKAEDLRQNSPFAGVLTAEQRSQALNAFRVDWARRHDHGRGPAGRAAGVAR